MCLCSPRSISNREHHWCQNQNIQVSQEFHEDITGCDLHRLPLSHCRGCVQSPDNISDLQSLWFYCYRLQIHLPDNMQTFSLRNLLPSTSPRKLQCCSQRTKSKQKMKNKSRRGCHDLLFQRQNVFSSESAGTVSHPLNFWQVMLIGFLFILNRL